MTPSTRSRCWTRQPEQGFAPGSFHIREIHAAEDRHDPTVSALLRAGVIEYARAQHGLSIPARDRPAAWGEAPPAYDAASELDAALSRRQFRSWLDSQPPSSPLYRTLQAAYAASRKPDHEPETAASGNAALLRANLERLRWLPRAEPATRVDVNIASATLIYLEDQQPRLTMRTASGKPGDETPMLTSTIKSIVLNPPWNVPAHTSPPTNWSPRARTTWRPTAASPMTQAGLCRVRDRPAPWDS